MTRGTLRQHFKIANWNIEWMDNWFDATSDPVRFASKTQLRRKRIHNVRDLARRIGKVILEIDADIVNIQEGPNRKEEMAFFVTHFLNDAYDVLGPSAGRGQQKLYTLIKKNSDIIAHARILEQDAGFHFDSDWDVDIEGNFELAKYRFTRTPLVTQIILKDGTEARNINLHLKSKYIHKGKRLWKNPETRPDYIRKAVIVRRRIAAEAGRIKKYLNLLTDQNIPFIVAGDLNDGPDLDNIEEKYTLSSVANIIAGGPGQKKYMLKHGFEASMPEEDAWTARFDDFTTGEKQIPLMLDHIYLSRHWKKANGKPARIRGRIEHDLYQTAINNAAPKGSRDHKPSDHVPQSVTLGL